jgi:peptidoglycan/LPS O-acetylase OafA/YrhL
MKYRSEIDGLRTMAVIPVILFHLDYNFVKGGFYGVDVFFVISGYLITRILTDDIGNNTFSMFGFWLRRVKRLLPLLLTVILFTLILGPLLLFKPVIKDISNDIFPALFSFFNYHALFDFGNYWGVKAEQSFFLHTWSLSVEEQFYLLYPIFLFGAHKYAKNFIVPILIITIISFCLLVYYMYIIKDNDSAFYSLQTRVWELSVGGLAALCKFENFKKFKFNYIVSLIGFFLIFISYLFGKEVFVFFPVLGSLLIIIYCKPNDLVGKVLSSKLFVFIGKLSYSLYLWHWIIILFYKNLFYHFQHLNHHLLNALILILVFALSYLSYYFIEVKTRNDDNTPKIVLAGVLLIIGLATYFQSNLYNAHYYSQFKRQISYVKFYDITPTLTGIDNFVQDNGLGYNVEFPDRLQKFNDAYKSEGIITNLTNGTPKIMLIGDSHGIMWAKLLDEISGELGVSLSCYTSNGSSPFFNIKDINLQNDNKYYTETQSVEYAKSIIQNIEKWKPKIVILACRWQYYVKNKKLKELLVYLEERNVTVFLFTQPPILNFMEDKNADQFFTYLGITPVSSYNFVEVSNQLPVIKGNDFLKKLNHKNIFIYDIYDLMIENNKVPVSLGQNVLYFDDDHLSYYGTLIHKDKIASLLKEKIYE